MYFAEGFFDFAGGVFGFVAQVRFSFADTGDFGSVGFDFAAGILWDSASFDLDTFADFGEGVLVLVAGVLLITADLGDFTIALCTFALGLAMIAQRSTAQVGQSVHLRETND